MKVDFVKQAVYAVLDQADGSDSDLPIPVL
jgi:hypothetical protein